MTVLGIDPGLSPAFAFLYVSQDEHCVVRVPEVVHEPCLDTVVDLLQKYRPERVYIERVNAVSGQGIASTAHLMTAWGLIRGVIRGMNIARSVHLVSPLVWKRALFSKEELGHDIQDRMTRKKLQKDLAVHFVHKHYPSIRLLQGQKRVFDHNLAEAVCIAHYGYHCHGQEAEI